MKKVQFNTIEITNFLSIGKTQTVSFADGITAIFGVNHDRSNDSNGVGKSTILSAVCFALYGDPIKNIKRDEVVNRIAGGKCVVSLNFSVEENGTTSEYKVERGVKPTFCKFYRGDDDISLSGIPETTKLIADTIGTSAVMFKNTCLMSLEDNIPFARQKAAEKREFIEGVFDLGFIKEMAKAAKQNADKFIAENTDANSRISEIKNQIEVYEKGEAEFEENRKEKIASGVSRLGELKTKKEALSSELGTIDRDEARQFENARHELKTKQDELDTARSSAEELNVNLIKEGVETKNEIANAKRRDEEHANELSEIKEEAKSYGISDVEEFLKSTTSDELDNKVVAIEDAIRRISVRSHELAGIVERNKGTIKDLKEKGNICLYCNRPFSDNDISERDAKIKALEEENANCSTEWVRLGAAEKAAKQKETEARRTKTGYDLLKKMYDRYSSYESKDTGVLEEKIVELRKKVADNKVGISKIADEKKAIDDKIVELDEKIVAIREKIAAYDTKLSHIKTVEAEIERVVSDIKATNDEPNKFTGYKKDAEDKLSEYERKRDDTEHMCEVYRVVRGILSDDGFKSYMVKQYINVLNTHINKYLEKLDAPIKLEFDEYLDDKIVDQMTGTVCSYDSLSGGEKRRVDIACLLAFSDLRMLRGDVLFSHSFYDEILDSALSPGACSKLMSILKDRYDEDHESSMIITHKQEMQDDPNIGHKILVEKIGGVSRLSDG